MGMIKVETDVDIQSEEDPIGMQTEEVHIHSPFSVKDEELKVSHFFLSLLVTRERGRGDGGGERERFNELFFGPIWGTS
jgi:hypothetical protein